MVRPVSLGVEVTVVMSDTSYGVDSGLDCGSSSLQVGDSTRGLKESGVEARVSLLSPGSVVGVSLLLAGDTELSRSVGELTTALLFITACSSKKTLKARKNIIFVAAFSEVEITVGHRSISERFS